MYLIVHFNENLSAYVYSIKISAFYTKFGGSRTATFTFLKSCALFNCTHWRSSFTQPTHVRDKNSNIQGRSPNVVKLIFHTIRNCLKRKEIAPSGSKFFPLEKFLF